MSLPRASRENNNLFNDGTRIVCEIQCQNLVQDQGCNITMLSNTGAVIATTGNVCCEENQVLKSQVERSKCSKPEYKTKLHNILNCIVLTAVVVVLVGLILTTIVLFNSKQSSKNTLPKESDGTTCSGEYYGGSTCKSILEEKQSCLSARENSSDVFVVLSVSQQTAIEQELNLLLSFIPISELCEDDLLALLCVEAFMGLCDMTGVVHRIPRQECDRITTTICAAEFEAISFILESRGFPTSCDTFPEDSDICSSDVNIKEGTDRNSHVMSNATRNCSVGFFVNEESDLRLCTPECGVWWPQSPADFKLYTILSLTFGSIAVILCITVLLLFCYNHKTMLKFPGILSFYQILGTLGYMGVYFSNNLDFKDHMCSSRDLVESLSPGNETPLCIIAGSAWIYITFQNALWWTFHVSMIFFAIIRPFKYRYWRTAGHFKYIHIAMVVMAIVLPIVPVIICFKLDGFIIYILFQPFCVARNPLAFFYSHILPVLLIVAVGVCLFTLVLWNLFSEEFSKTKKSKRQVEVKVLIMLIFYIITWINVMGVAIGVLFESQEYVDALTEIFTCEATGTKICSGNFEQFDVILKMIALLLIAFHPAIFLIQFFKPRGCGKRSL